MIVLVMIVRDEAHVIERCLRSVLPYVDAWVIADTGSTDDTPDIVRGIMDGLPGDLIEREWVDFSTNRNQVLDYARAGWPDAYALTIDADEVLESVRAPLLPLGGPDAYTLDVEYAGTRYRRTALIRLASPWRWVGPVHEYLAMEGGGEAIGHLTSPTVRVFHEGARSRDPETYRKDAALLEGALADDPTHPRWQFYLAQSYRDAGRIEAAMDAYLLRSENELGWWEERWFSTYQAGLMAERLGMEPSAYLLAAYEANPRRCEPLVELARVERLRERYAIAAMYAQEACSLIPDTNGLFVDWHALSVRRWDERAISSFYAGRPDLEAAEMALAAEPGNERLAENVRLIQEAR